MSSAPRLAVLSVLAVLAAGLAMVGPGSPAQAAVVRAMKALTPTATTLVASASRIEFGEPVEFTATVSSTGPTINDGTIAFRAGSTVLGSASVVNGTAVLSVSTLAVGNYQVTAAFSGTDELLPSGSGVNGTSPIRTIAGSRTAGFSGDGGAATSAALNYPSNLAVDGAGNVYVVDNGNNRIRKVATDGTITTVAGTGVGGFSGDGGPATEARLSNPYSIAVDAAGTIFIGDDGNNRIRKVDAEGTITTYAGTGTSGFSGDGGPATEARLRVASMAIDAAGTVYFTDQGNGYVRKITPDGIITTIAGTGTPGYSGDGGPGTSAQIRSPYGVGVDEAGNVYFAEISTHVIRRVTPEGIISTYAGTGVAGSTGDGGQATAARLSTPGGMAVDASGNVFFNQFGTNQVRKVTPDGVISTVAGNGTAGYSGDGGPSTSAQLYDTEGLAIDAAGNLYLADSGNNVVRRVDGAVALAVVARPTFTTGPTATITGTPTVGRTLVAGVGNPAPSPDSYSYVWYAGGAEITDNTSSDPQALDLTPDLVGEDITVEVTVHRDGYLDASDTSDPVGPVAKATFTTGPTATITGTPVVNGTLTAGPGPTDLATTVPSADSFSYAWAADGEPISGATSRTLALTPALAGAKVTVTVTAVRAGYLDAVDESDPTAAVERAVFVTGPEAAIEGAAVVGGTLSATPTDLDSTTPSADSYAYAWAADGQPVRGATGPTLTLTENEHGKTVTVTVTAARTGYTDVADTSDAVTVANGTQTGTPPEVTGAPTVGATLVAGMPRNLAAGATLRYAWLADGAPIAGAAGDTLLVTPELAGKTISVRVTVTLPGHEDLELTTTFDTPTAEATFTGTDVTVSGTAKVGEELTAQATSTPTAADTTYVWRRGGTVVGTGATYRLVKADQGHQLTITATLTRTGYTAATVAASSATVAAFAAPTLTLTPSTTRLREGQQAVLTWTVSGAESVTGTWATTPLATAGNVVVAPRAGRHTFVVTAANSAGSTTATVTLDVALPAKKLTVKATKRVRGTKKFTVKVSGLEAGEPFTVKYGRTKVTGTATVRGTAKIKLTAPAKAKAARTPVKVTGSLKDRVGKRTVTVLSNRLRLATAYAAVRASDLQVVTVTGLAKHERVSVSYLGKQVASGRADARGTFSTQFKAGMVWGTDTVTAKARSSKRTGKTTFAVGRRCVEGVWRCR